MYKKVFVDANIFIDVNDKNRKTHKESFEILKFLVVNRIEIYTSCDLITTIYYILSKKDKKNALNSITTLNKIVNIVEFSNKEVEIVSNLMLEDNNYKDLEDTLQYILAKKENCDIILSNDISFYSPDILVLSSKEFCNRFNIL